MSSEKNFEKTVKIISHHIKLYRKKMGLSQVDMAHKHGFDLRHYQRIETGKTPPSLYTVQRLADIFGVPIWKMLKPAKKV